LSRQLQTMSTIDAYVSQGVDLLHPRTNFFGWPGHLLLEFPIFQALAASISRITQNPIVTTRMINLIFGTLSILLVHGISRFWFDRCVAAYSSLFFAWAPLNIMFHRSMMVDVFCVFFALASQLILMHWWNKRRWWLGILFCIAGTVCVLIKPLYFLPVAVLFILQLISESQPVSREKLLSSARRYAPVFSYLLLIGGALTWWLLFAHFNGEGNQHALQSIGFSSLLKPQYYIKLVHRFMVHFVTPFNALLFMVGAFLLFQKDRKTVRVQLLAAPVLYYILFVNINFPHSYYSLIMIPYFAIVTGCGAGWLEDILQREGIIRNILISRLLISGMSMFTCMLMFLHGWTSFMILPQQRYAQIEREAAPHLEPMSYAAVYVNPQGNFAAWEHLRNKPALYLKSFFKEVGYGEIAGRDADFPLVRSAVLYALKQYGHMHYVNSINDIEMNETIKSYSGHLRYMIFYLFDDKRMIERGMKPVGARLIYESKDWMVYDLAVNP
jgi:hypothetical protein